MNNQKKIFYVWKSAYPWDVRIEKICLALHNAGYIVYILCRWEGEELEKEIIEGIHIIRIGFKENPKKYTPIPHNPFWKKKLENHIVDLKPDLIINREIILADISGKLAKKYKIPVIMDMAENYPAAMQNWKKYTNTFIKRLIFKDSNLVYKLEEKTSKLMNGIIVVCEENKERIVRNYNIYKNNIEVIYNTPSKDFFNKNISKKKNNKELNLIHHGHLTNEKNFIQFFKEFIKVVLNNSLKINLYIFGIGENYDDYTKLTPDKFKNNSIFFKGKYKFDEIYKEIENVDVGIIPYEVNDFNQNTIHNKIFDYMMMGKPIIVSNNKPLTNIINEFNCGWVISENKDLFQLLSSLSIDDIIQKGKNSRNGYIDKFNWEEDKKRLISFVEKFIK